MTGGSTSETGIVLVPNSLLAQPHDSYTVVVSPLSSTRVCVHADTCKFPRKNAAELRAAPWFLYICGSILKQ